MSTSESSSSGNDRGITMHLPVLEVNYPKMIGTFHRHDNGPPYTAVQLGHSAGLSVHIADAAEGRNLLRVLQAAVIAQEAAEARHDRNQT